MSMDPGMSVAQFLHRNYRQFGFCDLKCELRDGARNGGKREASEGCGIDW
jgi:hypothetical protein